jgi:predicted  nucleic acid-binding Zn-ribbon protein
VRQAAAREESPAWVRTPEVYTVHPDVRAAPVGVERMPEDLGRDSTADARDEGARPDLRARLGRAEQRRQAIAERVSQLRARTNVPVIKDVEEYQRLQEQLSDALDQLDRVEAEIARLRRALGNGRE